MEVLLMESVVRDLRGLRLAGSESDEDHCWLLLRFKEWPRGISGCGGANPEASKWRMARWRTSAGGWHCGLARRWHLAGW